MAGEVFPFGAVSSRMSPSVPAGEAMAFVLGVYPSAVHVRWGVPGWAEQMTGRKVVASLAVAAEPTVFWDGAHPPAAERVQAWAQEYFPAGDPERVGAISAGRNGSSGRWVAQQVLAPLGLSLEQVWLTDAVNRFFVKRGSKTKPGQADVIETVYQPIAEELGLPPASLPARPSPDRLVGEAVAVEADRLAAEWRQAQAPLLLTLGEESRRVMAELADRVDGPPQHPLRADDPAYGRPGRIRLGGHTAEWMALTHPGNRAPRWQATIVAWSRRQQPAAEADGNGG